MLASITCAYVHCSTPNGPLDAHRFTRLLEQTFCDVHAEKAFDQLALALGHGSDADADLERLRDAVRAHDRRKLDQERAAMDRLREAAREAARAHDRRKLNQKRAATSVVYFIERLDFIKIGFTTNLDARLKALVKGGVNMPPGVGSGPIELLATEPDPGRCRERELHDQFAHIRVPGTEWFRDSPDLRTYIDSLLVQAA